MRTASDGNRKVSYRSFPVVYSPINVESKQIGTGVNLTIPNKFIKVELIMELIYCNIHVEGGTKPLPT